MHTRAPACGPTRPPSEQRVSIGAELLADPSLFFLDEPTSGLDPGLEKKMMYTLRRLADSGRTIVLVTHEPDIAMYCSRIVTFKDGMILSDRRNPSVASASADLRQSASDLEPAA